MHNRSVYIENIKHLSFSIACNDTHKCSEHKYIAHTLFHFLCHISRAHLCFDLTHIYTFSDSVDLACLFVDGDDDDEDCYCHDLRPKNKGLN